MSNADLPGIIIGSELSDKLKVLPRDTITLMSPSLIESTFLNLGQKPGIQAVITGIFSTHAKEYDQIYAYSSDVLGIKLFKAPPESAHSIDIRLKNFNDVEKVKSELEQFFIDKGVIIQSWYDLHRELYNILRFERYASFIILSLIIIIAIFNVLASLSMTVVEKNVDIATLKAIGGSNRLIQRIYMAEGFIIGLISTIVGALLGLGFCYGQIHFQWFKLDTSKFLIQAIPVSVYANDVIVVCIFSLLLSFLAAIYPARRAARTIIAKAIREE
jgi:lipoprotein-releasing system permease protein